MQQTRSQHTASVSEEQWKHCKAVPRQQPTVDSKNSQRNAASEHAWPKAPHLKNDRPIDDYT